VKQTGYKPHNSINKKLVWFARLLVWLCYF